MPTVCDPREKGAQCRGHDRQHQDQSIWAIAINGGNLDDGWVATEEVEDYEARRTSMVARRRILGFPQPSASVQELEEEV